MADSTLSSQGDANNAAHDFSNTSFLAAAVAAATAEAETTETDSKDDVDVENPTSKLAASTTTIGILSGDENDTASVFSFDSYDKQPHVPLRFQNMLNRRSGNNNMISSDNNGVPFPSVNSASLEYNDVVNVCPCRCLFFTLKETLCMVMSALGCGEHDCIESTSKHQYVSLY
jgi:U3 small nucleolar RNA-associated protein 14